eukprot:Platyproteum_vivax@DN12200_c0_g1_i1.p1
MKPSVIFILCMVGLVERTVAINKKGLRGVPEKSLKGDNVVAKPTKSSQPEKAKQPEKASQPETTLRAKIPDCEKMGSKSCGPDCKCWSICGENNKCEPSVLMKDYVFRVDYNIATACDDGSRKIECDARFAPTSAASPLLTVWMVTLVWILFI